jgi:hypothetical protein
MSQRFSREPDTEKELALLRLQLEATRQQMLESLDAMSARLAALLPEPDDDRHRRRTKEEYRRMLMGRA